jgi:hypothetical protein
VNISLGSQESYEKTAINLLIQDLSAKFGTVFCISAANGGTGYRTINHLGSLSPAILVGAHVSKQTLTRHYRLQDGVEVPEHGLLHFSSVGPSYTGQLRPNLVAPGSALSATPLTEEGSAMLNGTSMSSPITAGAVAALLSYARLDDQYARLENQRKEKIQSVRDKAATTVCSLTSLPLGVRTALEESAEELTDFTMAQQGYGLLNIDAAYDRLLKIAAQINDQRVRFAELKINDNFESRRLYDRSNNIPPVKQVVLTLDEDGELTEATRLRLRNAATLVRLERVQIQSIDGTVKQLDGEDPLPFAIALPGKEGQQGRSLVLVLSNPANRGSFLSVRRLDQMEAGKTYVAHYNVYQNEHRLLTLLDVVHRPIELSDLQTEVNLPGIDVNPSRRVASYTNRDQAIVARGFHRYPVAVTQRDSALSVELGFGHDQNGMIMLQIYDPDGYLARTASIRKSPQLTSEQRTARAIVSTRNKAGIWEVTVNTYSGSWVGASGYDLLIEAFRFVPSVERLALGTKQAGSGGGPNETILSLMNSSQQVKSVTLNWGKTERIAPLKPFGIIPNHRTYKRIPLPEWNESARRFENDHRGPGIGPGKRHQRRRARPDRSPLVSQDLRWQIRSRSQGRTIRIQSGTKDLPEYPASRIRPQQRTSVRRHGSVQRRLENRGIEPVHRSRQYAGCLPRHPGPLQRTTACRLSGQRFDGRCQTGPCAGSRRGAGRNDQADKPQFESHAESRNG